MVFFEPNDRMIRRPPRGVTRKVRSPTQADIAPFEGGDPQWKGADRAKSWGKRIRILTTL